MPRTYRKPTAKESTKMAKARKMTEEGLKGEKDIFSRYSTTMAKDARDQYKAGRAMMESVPEEAREYEAYAEAGYKSGGMVNVRGQGAARKTKGCKIC
jgi:hypothetical protein